MYMYMYKVHVLTPRALLLTPSIKKNPYKLLQAYGEELGTSMAHICVIGW